MKMNRWMLGIGVAMAAVAAEAMPFGLNVRDFGAKGDGVTDDTAAIQKAIDALAAKGGGTLYFPYTTNGYLIASPAKEFTEDGTPVRAQLVLPKGFRNNIAFEGEMPCKLLYEYQVRKANMLAGQSQPTTFGKLGMMNTCLHSTWDAPEEHDPKARPWSVIAAPEGNVCRGGFSRSLFSMKNLEVRVHLNKEKMYPTMSAAFLKNCSQLVIQDCQFCLDDNVGDGVLKKALLPNPCHTVGLHMSGDQNDQQILRDVAVQGFRYGYVLGEHIVADHLYVHNCEEAVVFHDSTHLSRIGMLVAQHNRVILSTTRDALFGNPMDRVNVQIDLLNFEGGQTVPLPPDHTKLVWGVQDPGNRLHGSITWHEPWGKGVFPVEGAANFKITKF